MTSKSAYSQYKPIGHWPSWREAEQKAEEMSRFTGHRWKHISLDNGFWGIRREPWQ